MTTDVLFEVKDGIATLTLNRPEKLNAFSDAMLTRTIELLDQCRQDDEVRVIVVTGAGRAFCSGGDQKVRGDGGYVGDDGVPRLNVLDLQRKIRTLPKPVIAVVAGYAIGHDFSAQHFLELRLKALRVEVRN